jgi:hypothetical protein
MKDDFHTTHTASASVDEEAEFPEIFHSLH